MGSNYVTLNLKEGATLVEIKARFRVLCKELHPDKTGGDKAKTERFILVKAAYEALLNGDGGSNNYQQGGKKQEPQSKKVATYRFINIIKEGNFYLVKVNIENVYQVEICGKNYRQVGSYSTSHINGDVNLTLSAEAAKKAEYMFRITFYDMRGNWAEKTYKVKPPKEGILKKLKNLLW